MATTVKVMSEQKRARYSVDYRAEALSLAERVGGAAAARELELWALCHADLSVAIEGSA